MDGIKIDAFVAYLKCICTDQMHHFESGQDSHLIRAYAVQGILELAKSKYKLRIKPALDKDGYIIGALMLYEKDTYPLNVLYYFQDEGSEI